ncbi:Fanconi anemia group A protein isoform X4 [Syngnathoides biaculeatus]|uniref:Fanconi anemia group A protein isoform X4 n=1 Tax=Syngnathoides biaculeatus TaxID=300417 RepID=UPI002ADD6F90|nr:Fanconi anemia group A protein isoform X4 [Syngnathoides biaculeatus]
MSLCSSCDSVSLKRSLSSLLDGRFVKNPKQDGQQLQEGVIHLLEQKQDLCSLFKEIGNPSPRNSFNTGINGQRHVASEGIPFGIAGSHLETGWEDLKWGATEAQEPDHHLEGLWLLSRLPEQKKGRHGPHPARLAFCLGDEERNKCRAIRLCALRHQAGRLGVPLTTLSAKSVLERLKMINGVQKDKTRDILPDSQRVQLCVLLESVRELLSYGAICPKGLWQEYRKYQKLPNLHVAYLLQFYNILDLKDIFESDDGMRWWLVPQLKALCKWIPSPEEKEDMQVQQTVLSTILGTLVAMGFQSSQKLEAVEKRRIPSCISALDDMLFWLLDTVDTNSAQTVSETATERWCQLFDTSMCDVSASPDTLQCFFKHTLTQTLTYKPRLAVSDAIALQDKWTFAKTSPLLTSLFCKLAVVFSVKQLLHQLQQVLETHEVSWKHVLCFISTLLVFNPSVKPHLRVLLSRLLTNAFEGYDLENMITAFLLARQAALQGHGIFLTYSDWFKECFGGSNGFHTTSKKSLVFLLKFLSDLVPFEPPQYLKVHIIHPPYVPVKYRSLLVEYISLAKTRLADFKVTIKEQPLCNIDLCQNISLAGDPTVQCQAVQDVEKASSLFERTGKIPASVMEASIFRRTYFLTRFLPALLTPRLLPVKADTQMTFIEALKRADKIPAPQYSSYMETCQRLRQKERKTVCEKYEGPLHVLKLQLQEQRRLLSDGNDGDISAQLSKIAHTMSFIFPCLPDDFLERKVIKLKTDMLSLPEVHLEVVNMILKNFCQCILDASKSLPPNKQIMWASRFVCVLVCNTEFLSCLLHRLWHLLHNQGSLLSGPHMPGLAAFVVHLDAFMSPSPVVQLISLRQSEPISVSEALSSALVCNTHTRMHFCVRFCVAAMCYGICRGDWLAHQQHNFAPTSLYKKLLYLIPRLLPEARETVSDGKEDQEMNSSGVLSNATTNNWKKTALCLWRHPAFSRLQYKPKNQLHITEWLSNELQVDRSKDTFTDSERLGYHQWACLNFYLIRPEDQGGCGGSMKSLCSHLINAIMDQQQSEQSQEDHRVSQRGTCFPDIICRLQEVIYEMELSNLSGSHPTGQDICDFLFELVSKRLSETLSSPHLNAEHTLNMWNRVMLALPTMPFIKVKAEGDRVYLDCEKLIQHVNNHQRSVCSPSGLLSFHLTSHFLRSNLCASAHCSLVGEEFNKTWSQISHQCPLLLVSTAYWWEHLSVVLLSLWCRVCDEEALPEQLQLITKSQSWACSLMSGQLLQISSAPALLLASSLYVDLQGRAEAKQGDGLNILEPETNVKHREVLVFLLFLCVNKYLSALRYHQEYSHQNALNMCTDVLTVLVDCADWLLIFKSDDAEKGAYQIVTLLTSDRFTQLMPWAFYSLLLQQSAELQQRAVRCPGFFSTAVSCYISLLQLLDGPSITGPLGSQMESSQILSQTKTFLLRAISQMSPSAQIFGHITQLESLCAEFDPEVAAALSTHLDPHRIIQSRVSYDKAILAQQFHSK